MCSKGLISVIVPVYNVEPYLDECICSIVEQTYRKLQILLIDDGSTDFGGAVCDAWAKKDSRIQVIHQTNSGVSAARNTGLDHARGDVVSFVDADDFLPPNAYELLIQGLDHGELVIGRMRRTDEKGNFLEECSVLPDGGLSVQEFMQELFYEETYSYLGFLWDKLFLRRIIEEYQLRFDRKIKLNEDRLFLLQYLLHCKSVSVCQGEVYYYRYRENSAMATHQRNYSPESESELISFEQMKIIMKEVQPELYICISRRIYEKALYWLRNVPYSRKKERAQLRRYMLRNAGICILEKKAGLSRKVKIIGHCLLGR